MTELATLPLVELVTTAPVEQMIADYLQAFWPALPDKHIRMNASGPKYSWKKFKDDEGIKHDIALDYATLLEHAAGTLTAGAHLHTSAGLCRIGMLDIDAGGRAAIVAALAAAHKLGYVAYGLYTPPGRRAGAEHDGGRLVVPFADYTDKRAIIAVMEQIRDAAGLPANTEIWPGSENAVALPFGVHIRKQKRGELLLQSGEVVDLDRDLAGGFSLVEQLPTNAAPPTSDKRLSEVQSPHKVHSTKSEKPVIRQSLGEAAAGRASLDDVRARFNAEHTIESVLDRWGKATETRDGFACDCGVGHTHETTLYISKRGRLFSYSPRCHLYTTKGWDAFGLYVFLFHNNNVIAAAKELNPIQPRKAHQEAAQPATIYRTAQQDADAERRRAERRAAAEATRDKVAARAKADDRLTPCDRATLQAMLDWAAEHHADTCWAGRATIAQRAGYSFGSVKRSTMLLEDYGYFESEGSGGAFYHTAKRTFTRGSLFADETIKNAKDDPRIDPVACEGGAAAPAIENPAPAHQEAQTDEFTDASDDPPLDMAEIDRMVAEVQTAQTDLETHRKAPFVPHFVLAVNASERHEPQSYWDKHEARTWSEAHPVAPMPVTVVNQQEAKNEASKARLRAKWDAMGDNPSALGRELGVLRNYLKSHPSAIWPRWQITELNDRIAALTPVSEAVDSPPSLAPARRPAQLTPAMLQPDLFADAPAQGPYYPGYVNDMVARLKRPQVQYAT